MTDLAVVGAGPAGLAAATTAARAGLDVTLIDAAGQAGGQYWRHRPDSVGRDGQHDWSSIRLVARRARQPPGRRADPVLAGHHRLVPRSRRTGPAARAADHARRRGRGRRRHALSRRVRPPAADSRVGSSGRDGRGRCAGAAQGSWRRTGATRGGRRHRSVPAAGGDRPRRRRCRGGLGLRGRGAERLAPPPRRHPGCAVQARRGRRVRRRRCSAAASRTGHGPRSFGSTETTRSRR